LSESFHREIREKNIKQSKSEEWREKVSKGVKKLWQNPVYAINHLEALKRAQNTPEAIENHKKGALKYFSGRSESDKEKFRESMIQSWKDPEKRENRVKALKSAHNSIESKKRHSIATKKYLSIPENLRKRKEILRKTWAKPENREKLLEISKIGLKAAMSEEGRKNFYLMQLRPEIREKRSIAAKKRLHKLLIKRVKYNGLNRFLEQKLNEYGLHPVSEYPIGPYFVDFCFLGEKLVIEADGDFWHANPEFLKEKNRNNLHPIQKKMVRLDKAKNTYLKNHGWKLLRFWESDIKNNPEKCVAQINNRLKE